MISFWNADPEEASEGAILLHGIYPHSEVTFQRRNGTVLASGSNLRIDVDGVSRIGLRVAIPRELVPGSIESFGRGPLEGEEKQQIVVAQMDSWEVVYFSYCSKPEFFQRGDRLALGLIDDEILVGKNQTQKRKFVFNDPAILVRLPPDNRRWKPYYYPVLLLVLGSFLLGCVLMAGTGMAWHNHAWDSRSIWLASILVSFILFFLGPIAMLVREIRRDGARNALERREQIARLSSIAESF